MKHIKAVNEQRPSRVQWQDGTTPIIAEKQWCPNNNVLLHNHESSLGRWLKRPSAPAAVGAWHQPFKIQAGCPLTPPLRNGSNKRQEVRVRVFVAPAPPRLLPVPEGLSLLLPLLFSFNTSLPALSRKATTCLSWDAGTYFLAHWFTMRSRYTSVVICQRGISWPSAAAAAEAASRWG